MQKNDRFFTFQFSYSRKNLIKIRRIEISRKLIQTGSLSIFLVTVFSTFGVGLHGLIRNTAFASSVETRSFSSELASASLESTSYNYQRTVATEAVAVNSGGPIDPVDTDTVDDPAVESELSQIAASSNPENIPNVWAHLGKINNEFGFRR